MNNSIRIPNSYRIRKSEFDEYLSELVDLLGPNISWSNSDGFRYIKNEWAVHNFLYNLGILRGHTKDVDIVYPPKWYLRFMYGILGPVTRLFIK